MNIPNVRINRILENYLKETHTIPTITIAKPHVVVFSSFFFGYRQKLLQFTWEVFTH